MRGYTRPALTFKAALAGHPYLGIVQGCVENAEAASIWDSFEDF